MLAQLVLAVKALVALITAEGFFAVVELYVALEFDALGEPLVALQALKGLFPIMRALVPVALVLVGKYLETLGAHVGIGRLDSVRSLVFR